jgi:hypothetical protein
MPKTILKLNFPKYTDRELVCSFKKSDVPLSSSLIKLFESPSIELKNISSQRIPELIPEDASS